MEKRVIKIKYEVNDEPDSTFKSIEVRAPYLKAETFKITENPEHRIPEFLAYITAQCRYTIHKIKVYDFKYFIECLKKEIITHNLDFGPGTFLLGTLYNPLGLYLKDIINDDDTYEDIRVRLGLNNKVIIKDTKTKEKNYCIKIKKEK